MFDHLHEPTRRASTVNRSILLAAVVATLAAVGGVVYGVLWVLSALGFSNVVPPVEVHMDPFDDGTQLEDLIGEAEEPRALDLIDAEVKADAMEEAATEAVELEVQPD